MATVMPSTARCVAERTLRAAASGPGVSRCTRSPPASIPIPTSRSPERCSSRWRRPDTHVVGEFHYLHHDRGGRRYADPNAMGKALIQAATEAGVRLTLLDTCYLAGGLTAAGHLPLERGTEAFQRWRCRSLAGQAERAH